MEAVTILDSDSDLDRICRLCLASDKRLCKIFENDIEASEWTVADKLLETTSLQVEEEDGLPSQICSVCRTLLDAFHKFKIKCIVSDQTLRDYLENMDRDYLQNMDPNFESETYQTQNLPIALTFCHEETSCLQDHHFLQSTIQVTHHQRVSPIQQYIWA